MIQNNSCLFVCSRNQVNVIFFFIELSMQLTQLLARLSCREQCKSICANAGNPETQEENQFRC